MSSSPARADPHATARPRLHGLDAENWSAPACHRVSSCHSTVRVANTLGASAGGSGAVAGVAAAAHRAQADAVEIEAQANRRLADEYDAAQERGFCVLVLWFRHAGRTATRPQAAYALAHTDTCAGQSAVDPSSTLALCQQAQDRLMIFPPLPNRLVIAGIVIVIFAGCADWALVWPDDPIGAFSDAAIAGGSATAFMLPLMIR